VKAQGGIFGWVGASADLLPVLESKGQAGVTTQRRFDVAGSQDRAAMEGGSR